MDVFTAGTIRPFTPEERQKMMNDTIKSMGGKPAAKGTTTTAAAATTTGAKPSASPTTPLRDTSTLSSASTQRAQTAQLTQSPASVADRAKAATEVKTAQDSVHKELTDYVHTLTDANTKIQAQMDAAPADQKPAFQAMIDQNKGQMALAQKVMTEVAGYKAPDNMTSDQAQAIASNFKQIPGQLNDLKDPKTSAKADAKIKSLVDNKEVQHAGGGDEHKLVKVKHGDTLAHLAHVNGVTLAELRKANPELFQDGVHNGHKRLHDGGLIYPGDEIKIPGKGGAGGAKSPDSTSGAKPAETVGRTEAELKSDGAARLNDQKVIGQNVAQRIQDLMGAQQNLAKDLKDPAKHDEAKARMDLIDSQIHELQDARNQVLSVRIPPNLSQADLKTLGQNWSQVSDAITNLADPKKHDEAKAKFDQLMSTIQATGKPAPSQSRPAIGRDVYYA